MRKYKKYNRLRYAVKKITTVRRLRAVLIVLGGALLLTAVIIFLAQWNEGRNAARNAQILLDESGIKAPPSSPTTAESLPAATIARPTETPVETLPPELEGYTVIARLDIEKLELSLPVLSETTDKALKLSACRYEGAPGGNMVITGHNYHSGDIFGSLSEMHVGDDVLLTGKDGITYAYTVYAVDHIKLDDAEALNITKYDNELSLLTCENRGNGRLLVRCKLDE